MSDATPEVENGGGAGAAALATGDGGNGGGESWRDTLPDELRAAPEIANYQDLPAAVRGLIESKKAATVRVPNFKTDDGIKAFADAVRPENADGYDIPVPEGQSDQMVGAFREFAHETGMPPAWAKATAEFYNAQAAAALDAEQKASQVDVDKLKIEMGGSDFDEAVKRSSAMLKQFGVQMSDDDLAKLDAKMGSANLLRFLFEASDRIGEPAVIEGGGGAASSASSPESAKARWEQAKQDSDWRGKAMKEGTAENAEYKKLQRLIAAGKRTQPKGS